MKEKLLKELQEELLRLEVLLSINERLDEKHTDYLEGRIEELDRVIDLIKLL